MQISYELNSLSRSLVYSLPRLRHKQVNFPPPELCPKATTYVEHQICYIEAFYSPSLFFSIK